VPLARKGLDVRNEDGTANAAWFFREFDRTMSKYGKNVNWPFNLAAKVERGTV